ncbi:hypothetical protein [Lactococcus taiwanensis]|uniref:hypothetical protein n=1 Tax=Lactococcus taiwanensis TaxID=1151742 RepID=UPI001966B5EB|nr:hypothetical protein [Lactococcus taiwanensis]QRZ11747.1 hypothetical protein JVB21_03645 [Lactococcus taiwanensis]
MKLDEIESVGVVVKNGQDYGLIESEVIQGISMLPIGTNLYTAEQIQEYMVENVRHALTLYGSKVCGFHLEQLTKEEIEKIIQELFTEDQHD